MNQSAPRQAPETWGSLAENYEEMFVPFSSAAAAAALREIDLRAGLQFLDIAAGTGALTVQAAATGARVTAVDFSAGMLRALTAKLDGSGNVETHVMNGLALRLDDRSFDRAGSNMGIVLFSDPVRGLTEMRRVLREGGRGFVTTIASLRRSTLMQTIFAALACVLPQLSLDEAPAFEPLASSAGLSSAFEEAGFREIRVETVTIPWVVHDPTEFWHRWGTVAPPVAPIFDRLPKDRIEAASAEFARLVHESHGAGPAIFPTEVLIGLGSR